MAVIIMRDIMDIIGANADGTLLNARGCQGNTHNCKKVKYQILASRSDGQKNNGVRMTNEHYKADDKD